jgi:uncharacterized protein YndB with AHSA1/START domain
MSTTERIIKMKRTVKAGPERVFAFLTQAGRLREWFCDQVWSDPQPGGRFFFRWNSGYEYHGVFMEIAAPEEIVWVWRGLDRPSETLVEFELAQTDKGTELEVEHTGFGHGIHWDAAFAESQKAWQVALDNLVSVLEEGVDLRDTHRPFLGVSFEEMNAQRAEEEDIATETGIYLNAAVEGSAAEAAGLQAGDVIVALNEHKVATYATMGAAMQSFRVGETVDVSIVRGQERLTLSATLTGRPLPEVPSDQAEALSKLKERHDAVVTALKAACAGLGEEEAGQAPSEGQWTVKQVMAHLVNSEDFAHWQIGRIMMGQWTEGDYDPTLAADRDAALLMVVPTLEALLNRLLANMQETLLIIENLPEAARAELHRFHQAVNNVQQFWGHTEGHIRQIEETVAVVRGESA